MLAWCNLRVGTGRDLSLRSLVKILVIVENDLKPVAKNKVAIYFTSQSLFYWKNPKHQRTTIKIKYFFQNKKM